MDLSSSDLEFCQQKLRLDEKGGLSAIFGVRWRRGILFCYIPIDVFCE